MAYDYQIRPGLTQSGYTDTDISYDPNRKAVTLKGKDFLTGNKLMNVAGSTFTDRGSFDNALKGFQQQEQAEQTAAQNRQRIDALTGQLTNTQMPSNPYTSQLDQQIKDLMNMARTQQNVDPYSTPQYAAYQAQSGRRSNEGIRAAQESLGSSGFGRSTALGERAQGIQNQETEYLETQIIPQLIAAEEARRQQQFGNLQSLLNPVQGQQAFFDNRAQTERGNVRDALSMLLGEDQRGIDNSRYTDETQYNRGRDAAADAITAEDRTIAKQDRNIQRANDLQTQFGVRVNPTEDYSQSLAQVEGLKPIVQQNQEAAAKQIELELQAGTLDNETAAFKLEQLKDPNSPVNKAAAIDMELKQLELQFAEPEMQARLDQIRKATAQIGAAPYQSELDRKLDQMRLDTATEELKQLKNKPAAEKSTTGNFTLSNYKSFIDQNFSNEVADPSNPFGAKTKQFDANGARTYIIGLGLPDDQTDQLLNAYQLPTN